MDKKNIILFSVIILFLTVLFYFLSNSTIIIIKDDRIKDVQNNWSKIEYEEDFSIIRNNSKTYRIVGILDKNKETKYDKINNTFSFYLKDKNNDEIQVIYEGVEPNNFEFAPKIVVTGKYNGEYFEGKDILTKCPTKYSSQ